MRTISLAAAAAVLAACSQPTTDGAAAQQEPAGTEAAAAPKLGAEDAVALVTATGYTPGPDGTVENICGDRVSPQTLPANVGGSVGLAWLVIVPGGASSAACYGDVPGDMYLMARDGAGWRTIFSGGGYINILPATGTDGVHDFALGGPGFEFPVYSWNGTAYDITDRTIDDAEYGQTPSIP